MMVSRVRMRIIAVLFFGAIVAGSASRVSAQGKDTNSPNLPPDGVYLTPDQVHAMYTGQNLQIVLTAIQHQPFASQTTVHKNPANNDETEDFPSDLKGMMSVNGGPPQPFDTSAQVQTLVHNHSSPTGIFQTEMLQLNIQGGTLPPGVMIRESPTLQSTGQTTVVPKGTGFHIDSFFDVFTELSVDGGQSWIPSDGSTRVQLVPEPSSFVLCGLGLAAMGLVLRRRRKA